MLTVAFKKKVFIKLNNNENYTMKLFTYYRFTYTVEAIFKTN